MKLNRSNKDRPGYAWLVSDMLRRKRYCLLRTNFLVKKLQSSRESGIEILETIRFHICEYPRSSRLSLARKLMVMFFKSRLFEETSQIKLMPGKGHKLENASPDGGLF